MDQHRVSYMEAPLADWLDAPWRYELRVPEVARFFPGSPTLPDASQLTLIGRYTVETPACELSVWGMELRREVDIADWVTELPILEGKSSAPMAGAPPHKAGSEADLELAWEERHSKRAGRLFATRTGRRLFVLLCSANTRSFAMMNAFAECVASFSPVEEDAQPFAEGMQTFTGETPRPWKVALPSSWVILPSSTSERTSGFQARNVKAAETSRGSVVGHLAFAVASRDSAKNAAQVAGWYLDELKFSGLTFEVPEPVKEKARKPFKAAFTARMDASFEDYQGEIRYRVLYHPQAWVIAGLAGILRQEDAASWMQNKRALDILTRSVSLLP